MTPSHTRTRRPSAALVVAIVALVAALTGSAIALPGKNTVDKNDIQKNAVKTKTIKAGAVTEPKLGDRAVSSAKIAEAAITTAKIADAAVSSAKLANASVSSAKIADSAVSRAKIADAAVDSAKVENDSLTGDDLAPGVVSVVAYGRINNPDPGGPAIAPGDVGLVLVSGGAADGGRTTVSVSSAVLPPGGLATCSVQATPVTDPVASNANTLGFDTVTVATGGASTTQIQVQTRGAAEALNDFDYFVQVTCPNV
jgi:hypothetical protein